ncbi:P-loop containing nucleoside triphosphate hydrolase protein [Polychytrium aggregatum]|uniref:P-loop containing nucleoside triphosphate hydrolase protein n=1 Tax=Polychytrium aggregatum TaxID=110093 RepID=UPI0022FE8F15|nr:P-loop containing nucleoside triphosphate hydrolase protein [Polychytrium aggregatum]KAI9208840.1 P-loop containing nucleoside triphosphate hydrolase protein [Polychytrium aggregatum]
MRRSLVQRTPLKPVPAPTIPSIMNSPVSPTKTKRKRKASTLSSGSDSDADDDEADEDMDDAGSDYGRGDDDDDDGPVVKKPKPKPSVASTPIRSGRPTLPGGKITLAGGRGPLTPLRSANSPHPSPGADNGQLRAPLAKPFKAPTFVTDANRPSGCMKAGTCLGARRKTNVLKGPLHDPEADDAIVLYHPKVYSAVEILESLKSSADPKKQIKQEVHVVIDPKIARVLRPHQIEGVRFLYECTTGMKVAGAFGCIMADEMGLGKTLQCITLLWTLLRQSPEPGRPTIDKAIIVCPSSLVRNWANELKKWLGADSIRPFACDNKTTKEQTIKDLEQFTSAKGRAVTQPVLIISYESLRAYSEILCKTEIGLLLCDEGHRLKNADSQTYQGLNALNAKRRVILSGTPIQNDLTEYFALLSFAIPNVLGTESEFRKNFELPILRGRDADASDKDRETSEAKLSELLGIANKFIIRRTAELLTKYLPVKYEHVVFCKLTDTQLGLYRHFLESPEIRKLLTGKGSQPLKAITMLKKLCNHPALLGTEDFNKSLFPPKFDFNSCQSEFSGKMFLLEKMLHKIKTTTSDKIVLISNYTQTLDLFDKMCRARHWGCLRLDGTMTIQKRQKLVDQFNDPTSPQFVFLLSSKAGGCGLNLIGANRLVLFDPDWNPANDGQALARVWRDGQKKMCFIYRFIATGSIEEKIFQRQAHKQSLSSCVVDEAADVERHFSQEALRQLFQLNETTLSDTHDTFKCKRCIKNRQVVKPPEGTINTGATAADTSTWSHLSQFDLPKAADTLLKECAHDLVTYIFQNKSHDQQIVKTK